MTAIEILRAASPSVPNEDYVQFMAAVDAVAELIDKVDSALKLGWSDTAARELRAAIANVGGA